MSLMESLTKLYEVDRQVRGLRSRLESARRYHLAQIRLVEEIRGRLDELHAHKMHLQARIANLETEGLVLDERLEKFRTDLNSAATNKQYNAVLTELNTVKDERSRIDDSTLAEMDEVERVEAELIEVEDQRTERTKVRDHAEEQFQEREQEVGARLAELEQEREQAASDVPGTELAVFEEMADVHDGEAMARVEEIDRRHREYACGACNMHMPFEQVSSLMGSSSTIVRCTACGRLLFLHEEMRGALTPK